MGYTEKAAKRKASISKESTLRLCDVAKVSTNNPSADFWIVRRGAKTKVGQPTYEFNPEHIGIKILRSDIVLPRYLYYCLMHVHSTGHWEKMATGTLELVNITTSDIKHIVLTST